MTKATILVIDDEVIFRQFLARALAEDYNVLLARDDFEARQQVNENIVDVVLLDFALGDKTAIDYLPMLLRAECRPEVIIVSGQAQTREAVRCVKMGAYDFIPKPFELDELTATINQALQKRQLQRQRDNLINQQRSEHKLVGSSQLMEHLREQIATFAPTDVTVLIQGETGTGKELVARQVHLLSNRSAGPYQIVNCAAIPRELAESELFGYRKGSFTGAGEDRKGKIEAAGGGSIFLDEIGELPLDMQARLLRFLENREFQRIGDTETCKADVRVIAATNKDLESEVEEGRFRSDLFYRLNVCQLQVPPLNDRREDIGELVRHFIKEACYQCNKRMLTLTDSGLKWLEQRKWPGNVRQLKNMVFRAVISATGDSISGRDFKGITTSPDQEPGGIPADSLDDAIKAFSARYIQRVLAECDGSVKEAAEQLNIHRSTLSRKLTELGIADD